MAGQPASASVPEAASQGLRPVDPVKRLARVLGVKLTADLRTRIAAAAITAGVSDSAWLRQKAVDALGLESAADTTSGRRSRFAPEDQAALAGVVRDLGEATLAAKAGRTNESIVAMEQARQALVPVVIRFGRRA